MNFSTLKTKISLWIDRGDLNDVIVDCFNSAIRTIEEENNYKHMKVRYVHSLSSGDYAFNNPITNYKELINAHIIDSNGYRYQSLNRISQEKANALYSDYTNDTGLPRFITLLPAAETSLTPDALPTQQWLIRPTSDDSYSLEINAYQYSPSIDESTYTTNWWTQNRWDIALYATLLELEPFVGNDSRMKTWDSLLTKKLVGLIRSDNEESISGSMQNIESPIHKSSPYNFDTD